MSTSQHFRQGSRHCSQRNPSLHHLSISWGGGSLLNATRLHVPQKPWLLMGLEASEVTTSSYEHSGGPGAFRARIHGDRTCYDPPLELEYILWIVSQSPSLPGMWFKYTRLPNAKGISNTAFTFSTQAAKF